MKKGKQIGILLLCLTLIAGLLPVFAEEGRAFQKSDEVNAFFRAFSLSDDEIDQADSITRGQFAHMVKKSIGGGGAVPQLSADFWFTDVTDSTSYADAIYAMAGLGYMLGGREASGQYEFRPSDPISMTEAAKVMVDMLGYQAVAAVRGGYPAGYLAVAQSIGLLSGMSTAMDKPANPDAAKQLIYNALHTDVADENISGGGLSLTTQDGETYITKRWQMEVIEGVVTENSFLSPRTQLGKNKVRIDNTEYISTQLDENFNYFGMQVRAYRYKSSPNGELFCMIPRSRRSVVQHIRADRITRHNGLYRIDYEEEDGNEETVVMSDTAEVYYNFTYVGPVRAQDAANPETSAMLALLGEDVSCEVVLIDADGDQVYDRVWIRRYTNVLVKDFTYRDYKLNGMYGEKLEMDEAYDNNNVIFMTESGELYDPSSLEKNAVVSIFTETDSSGKIVRAAGIVSNLSAAGSITEKTEDGYRIGDKEYKLSEEYAAGVASGDKNMPTLKLGTDSVYFLNFFGYIVGLDLNQTSSGGSMKYAFLMRAVKEGAFGDSIILQLLSEEDEILRLPMASVVTINGTKYTSGDAAFKTIVQLSQEPQTTNETGEAVIIYKLGKFQLKDGEIKELEIEVPTPATDRLYVEEERNSQQSLQTVVYKASTIGKSIGLTSGTVVFNIPNYTEGILGSNKAFYMSSSADFVGDCIFGWPGYKSISASKNYTLRAYNMDSTRFAEVVVRFYPYVSGGGGNVGMPELLDDVVVVDRIAEGLNSEGESTLVIQGMRAGEEVRLTTDTILDPANPWAQFPGLQEYKLDNKDESDGGTPSGELKPGDIIQVLTNTNGDVINMFVHARMVDHNNMLWVAKRSGVGFNAGYGNEYLGVNVGTVKETRDGKVVMEELDGNERVYMISGINVTRYNRATKTISKGSVSDIEPGKDLYIRQYYSGVKEAVCFE